MSAVWSILSLIIGFVVAYLIYEEYVVDRENGEESALEMDIQEDLAEMVVEAGILEAADAAPHRSATGELVDGTETDAVAAEATAVAPAAVATAVADEADVDEADADEAVDIEESASVDAAEEESVAEEALVVEAVVVEERVVVVEVEIDEPAEVALVEAVQPDDLTKIKGIGKVYAQRLNEAGIVTYVQLIDTDEETLEVITKAIPAANAYDWARQARKLS